MAEIDFEVRAIHKIFVNGNVGRFRWVVTRGYRIFRATIPIDAGDGFFEMKISAFAGGIFTVPIEEPEGCIGSLLDFSNKNTTANSMNGACRKIKEVTRFG